MKKDNIIKIVISLIVIAILAYISIFGLNMAGRQIIKGAKLINTGLDISGGVSIIYQAQVEEETEISAQDLKKSEAVIRKRLEAKNIYDYVVRSDASMKQISVEIPADINDTSKDPLEVVEGLDKTAKIEFRSPDSEVLLEGNDIKSARYSEEPTDSTGMPSPHVVLTFSEEGAKKFAEATGKLVGKEMSIYLDETLVASPIVNDKIESNTAIITMGQGTYAEKRETAQNYAMLIDSGALPFSLNIINKEYVGPYVGQKALDISVKAGIISLVLIIVVMLIKYRIPGLVASMALVTYAAILMLTMSNMGISLTLSGIAGLILSLGMAVDANIIIFERLKEELVQKNGPKKAFEKSFKSALTAIMDGNITTCIVAILLYIFGIGSIKGFGLILFVGVVISFFTAVIITKYLLKQFVGLASKNAFLFGIKKEVE